MRSAGFYSCGRMRVSEEVAPVLAGRAEGGAGAAVAWALGANAIGCGARARRTRSYGHWALKIGARYRGFVAAVGWRSWGKELSC